MKPSILIGLPFYDRPEWECFESVLCAVIRAERDPDHPGIIVAKKRRSVIWRARDALLGTFMASGLDYFLSIDGDIQFRAEDIDELIACNVELVSGVYRKRMDRYELPFSFTGETRRGLRIANSIPGGFYLLSRRGAERIWKHFDVDLYRYEEGGVECRAVHTPFNREGCGSCGEDIAFSHRFREAGGTIFVHPGVVANHVGTKTYVTRPIEEGE